jgi:hypothetical protein
MFILFILAFSATYLHVSVTDQIHIIIWIAFYLIANLIIGFHPFSFYWNIIRILSIILILYLSYKNLDQNIYSISLLIPISKDKISYVHEFEIKSLEFYKTRNTVLFLNDLKSDLNDFIDGLDEDSDYWISLSFFPTMTGYGLDDGMQLYIADPILINKDSSSILLTQFIENRLQLMIDFYYLDDSIFDNDEAIIVVKFTEIELA